MTGFHVDVEGLSSHADALAALSSAVSDGASAEVTGTGQADFGVLIGHTIGYGITALSDRFAEGLRATAKALDATAEQVRNTAANYDGADHTSQAQSTQSGAAL